MTSGPEMHAYAQEAGDSGGDSGTWDLASLGEPGRLTHEELSRQYKMRCNELIDATQERMELERLRDAEEERLSIATTELFKQFIAVLDRYAKHDCGKIHDKGAACTCGLDACREAIEKRIAQEYAT